LTSDFVRSVLVGSANPGTSPVEKILNPLVEGLQLQWRSLRALARRLFSGGHYPGLAEILEQFYSSLAAGRPGPLSPQHLTDVSGVFERITRAVFASLPAAASAPGAAGPDGPVVVVTGAAGFFGRRIATALAARGCRVRGVARSPDTRLPAVHEWVAADLSRGVPPAAFAGADAVVHAAAATSGGLAAHQRHSVDATRNVVEAMAASGVRRLVYVSSISVLEPPRTPWEVQTENTPLAAEAAALGPYTWGKTEAERVAQARSSELNVQLRVVRPAALVDFAAPEMPGLLGRRLYGRWHLGLGRPGLPLAICDVALAGEIVAWMATHFEAAPPVANLWDPTYPRRRDILRAFRERGWRGRVVWIPIRLLGYAAHAARLAMGLLRGTTPSRLSIVDVLRARRFDPAVSRELLSRLSSERSAAVGKRETPGARAVAASAAST
jgi:UDP-glucose 4-epimerase